MSRSEPQPELPADPRQRLIAIAMRLLDDHHPEDLSLREVARRAGLTSGAPAHHFGNKAGLLAACAELAWNELCLRMEAVPSTLDASASVQRKAKAYIGYALKNPGPYRLATSRMFADNDAFPGIATWRVRAMSGLVELVEQELGTKKGDPKRSWRRGFAVWALMHGQVTLLLDGAVPDAKVTKLTREICEMAPTLAFFTGKP